MQTRVTNNNKVSVINLDGNQKTLKSCKLKNHFGASYLIYNLFGYNLLPLRGSVRVWVNVACVGLSVLVSVSLMKLAQNSRNSESVLQFLCILFDYYIIVAHCAIRHTPFNYLGDMPIDKALNFGKTVYIKFKRLHIIFVSLMFVIKCFAVASCCFFYPNLFTKEAILPTSLGLYIVAAVDFYQIPRIVYFTAIYYRARMLRKYILTYSYIYKKGSGINKRAKNVYTPFMLYRGFLDGVDTAAPQVNPMLMMSLFWSFPKMLCYIYRMLVHLSTNYIIECFGISLYYILSTSILDIGLWLLPCVPGIINEMTASQLHQLKLSLAHQLLICENDEQRSELEAVLRYMNLRKFNYRIWRLVRIDATLFITMLSLCTTYLIVILQFTKLYH